MPKIIENLRERFISEVENQLKKESYEAVTIRSIAKACGVGIGTVYNYFPSKESLIAAFLLEDWNICIENIQTVSETSETPEPVLRSIFDQLLLFSGRHETVFHSVEAVSGYAGSFNRYHDLLRSQLAGPLQKYCGNDFSAQFIAESLLTWTLAGKSFDDIYQIIKKII